MNTDAFAQVNEAGHEESGEHKRTGAGKEGIEGKRRALLVGVFPCSMAKADLIHAMNRALCTSAPRHRHVAHQMRAVWIVWEGLYKSEGEGVGAGCGWQLGAHPVSETRLSSPPM